MKLTPEQTAEVWEILLHAVEHCDNPYDNPDFRRDGEYKHQHWDMVGALKGVSPMASLEGYRAIPILKQVLDAHGYSLTDLGYESEGAAIDDLEALWENRKMALREAPLEAAVRMAKAKPIEFQTTRISENYQLFLNIGYRLQEMRGDEFIVLPVVRLGKILGVSWRRVTDYRRYAKKDGYLIDVAKSCRNANGNGLAAKFSFVGQFD
jgi:hypothetical protein